jgi:Mechanosensitive ion channel, conserved TM helix
MDKNLKSLFYDLGQKIIGYLPSLLGGLFLILLGWLIAWIVKRIVIQLLVILRFDRLFLRFRWKSSLTKADIRYALYNLIGNICFFIVFLVFLNAALDAMKLSILSRLIEQGVLFIPRLIVALVILGIGWLIAARSSKAVHHALMKENVPSASLLARFMKFIVILFFSAMALVQLSIAKEIVLIGFSALFLTLSVSAVILLVPRRDSLKGLFNGDKDDRT